MPCGDEKRDNATVGMADQMRALLEQRRELLGLALEVDPLEWRIRRIAAPRRDHEPEALREGELCRPRRRAAAPAAVDEQNARARAELFEVKRAHRAILNREQSRAVFADPSR